MTRDNAFGKSFDGLATTMRKVSKKTLKAIPAEDPKISVSHLHVQQPGIPPCSRGRFPFLGPRMENMCVPCASSFWVQKMKNNCFLVFSSFWIQQHCFHSFAMFSKPTMNNSVHLRFQKCVGQKIKSNWFLAFFKFWTQT